MGGFDLKTIRSGWSTSALGGAKVILHPGEGWGAILLLENNFVSGNIMFLELVPLIREAILEAEQT